MARSRDDMARRWHGRAPVHGSLRVGGVLVGALLAGATGIWAGLDAFAAGIAALGLAAVGLLAPARRVARSHVEGIADRHRDAPDPRMALPFLRRRDAGLGASLPHTKERVRPFEFALCVERHQDLVQVQRLTQRALIKTHRVLDDPEPFSVVEKMGDFGVTLRVRGWVGSDDDPGRARSESIREVQLALGSAGVRLAGRGPAQWTTDA